MPRKRTPDIIRIVGARVAQARRARGFSQELLAEALGVAPVTLSRQETGHRAMSLSMLAEIAGVLEVRLADLLDAEVALPEPKRDPIEQEIVRLVKGLDDERRDLAIRVLKEIVR